MLGVRPSRLGPGAGHAPNAPPRPARPLPRCPPPPPRWQHRTAPRASPQPPHQVAWAPHRTAAARRPPAPPPPRAHAQQGPPSANPILAAFYTPPTTSTSTSTSTSTFTATATSTTTSTSTNTSPTGCTAADAAAAIGLPGDAWGAVRVAHIPGRGRGVVAAAPLAPGDLVVCSEPLALVTCGMGDIPGPDALADAVLSRAEDLTDAQWAALLALHAGDAAEEEAEQEEQDEEAEAGEGAAAHKVGSSSSSSRRQRQVDEMRLYGIIGCNSFGEAFLDFASAAAHAAARGEPPSQHGHLGLFPGFAMLNHSCLPNAVNYVVGGRMVVVAAAPVAQGQEVTINYLGRASLRPVGERQETLAEGYGFACGCERCRGELLASCGDGYDGYNGGAAGGGDGGDGSNGGGSFAERVQALLARCDSRTEAVWQLAGQQQQQQQQQAASEERAAAVAASASAEAEAEALLGEARADVAELEAAVAAASAPAAEWGLAPAALRSWLRGSAFDVLSAHTAAAEAAGRAAEAADALAAQLRVCEAVAPHSDLHMYLQVKALSWAQQQQQQQQVEEGREGGGGPDGPAARAALAATVALLRGRYGGGTALPEAAVAALLQGAAAGLAQVVV